MQFQIIELFDHLLEIYNFVQNSSAKGFEWNTISNDF